MTIGARIHIGAHATGAGHLQRALRRQRPMLAAGGVAAFLPGELRRGPTSVMPLLKPAGAAPGTDRDKLADAFDGARSGAETLVLSDENIPGGAVSPATRKTGKLYPEAHIRLHRLISGLGLARPGLFLCTRDPAEFLAAAYARHIRRKGFVPAARFVGDLDPCTLSWSELIERLRTIPGVGAIAVWRYEDTPRITRTALRHLLPAHVAAGMVLPAAGPGPDDTALISEEAHRMMARAASVGAAPDAAGVRSMADACPVGPDAVAFRAFPEAQHGESLRYYREDFADLSGVQGVTLLTPQADGAIDA